MLDEYTTAKLPVTQLNLMCDGTYAYPVKGGVKVTLKDPLIIICGNASPSEVYPKTW